MDTNDFVEFCASCGGGRGREWQSNQLSNGKCPFCQTTTVSLNLKKLSHLDARKIFYQINPEIPIAVFPTPSSFSSISTLKTTQNITSNMNQQLENQIDLLTSARSQFLSFKDDLERQFTLMKLTVEKLSDEGLNHDYIDAIDQSLTVEILPHLQKCIALLEEDFLPSLGNKIKYLEDRI